MLNDALRLALRDVVGQLMGEKSSFDSHEIIFKLIEQYERDYVELLSSLLENTSQNGIFKEANRQIALEISYNASAFGLRKRDEDVLSLNIKGYESECACWDVIR
jgi:hypothetical protein